LLERAGEKQTRKQSNNDALNNNSSKHPEASKKTQAQMNTHRMQSWSEHERKSQAN